MVVICRRMNKYVTEVSQGSVEIPDVVDASISTGKLVATNSSIIIIIDENYSANRSPTLDTYSCPTSVPAGYQRPYAEFYVIKINFEKLTEPSNGKSCATTHERIEHLMRGSSKQR